MQAPLTTTVRHQGKRKKSSGFNLGTQLNAPFSEVLNLLIQQKTVSLSLI